MWVWVLWAKRENRPLWPPTSLSTNSRTAAGTCTSDSHHTTPQHNHNHNHTTTTKLTPALSFFLGSLLLWHGRNAYKRSARLSQFVIHRGLIISIIQAVFSALFFFAAIAIYNGWLMVGYATFYTMLPGTLRVVCCAVLCCNVQREK
jgi:hypothetical protein